MGSEIKGLKLAVHNDENTERTSNIKWHWSFTNPCDIYVNSQLYIECIAQIIRWDMINITNIDGKNEQEFMFGE